MNASPRAPRKQPVTVAIVDDFQLVVDGLVAHFADKRLGIEVTIQATSWAGLVEHPNFPAQVTVLDLNLGDGIQLAPKVHSLLAAGSQVVVISRHADALSVSRALHAGALGFVPKTDGAADLVQAVRAAAAGQRFLAQPLAEAVGRLNAPTNPGLGRREYRAIILYATGRSIREVATEMQTTDETVKSYIKRARRKYREVGIDLGTRDLLRRHGIREGWLTPE